MDSDLKPQLSVHENIERLSNAAAAYVAKIALEAIDARGACSFVLSGGNTPRLLYRTLARDYATRIPWEKVQFFMGDERFVPELSAESNVGMVRRELLGRLPIPATNIQVIDTSLGTAAAAAEAYDKLLHSFYASGTPGFDIVLLGAGSDGHTASIFPNTPEPTDGAVWVINTLAPHAPHERITMTSRVLSSANYVCFLFHGAEKARILTKILDQKQLNQPLLPAARINAKQELVYFVDKTVVETKKN